MESKNLNQIFVELDYKQLCSSKLSMLQDHNAITGSVWPKESMITKF